ncbi:MAG: AsmA family protein, partial [Verrucomicrobiales bacterium]|nr:AsmA family protein [Verrucomicrobiales bacterium]
MEKSDTVRSADSGGRPERGGGLLRGLLKVVGGLGLGLVLIVTFLLLRPTAFDLGRYSVGIERQVSVALGREVSIEGEVVLLTGLTPAIRIEKITLHNPVGWASEGDFAYLQRFETSIGLLEWFDGEINIDDVRVTGLKLYLERDAEGLGNWEGFAQIHHGGEGRSEEVAGEGINLEFKELGGIDVRGLKVSYQDPAQEQKVILVLDQLNGAAKFGQNIQLALDGNFLDHPFHGQFEGGTLTELRARKVQWPFDLAGHLGSTALHLQGQFSAKDFAAPGIIRFDLDIPQLEELLPMTGELPDIGSLQLVGEARRTAKQKYSLANLTGRLGKQKVSGTLDLDLSGDIPRLDGELKISAINLAVFSQSEEGAEKAVSSDSLRKKIRKLHNPLFPVVGNLRLQIDELKGEAKFGQVENLIVETFIEQGQAEAKVSVDFAGTALDGRLLLKRSDATRPISFDLDLKSERADLADLIRYYTKSEDFEGSFEKLRYQVDGSGDTLVDAWVARRVLLEVEGAKMVYHSENKDWRFYVSKGSMNRSEGGLGEMLLEGTVGDAGFDVAVKYELELWGEESMSYLHSMKGKVADLEFNIKNKIDEGHKWGDADFSFSVHGGSLDRLDLIYEMDLPPTGKYSAEGVFKKRGKVYEFYQMKLALGSSKISGSSRYESKGGRASWEMDLNAKTLQLDDFLFEQWSPTESKKVAVGVKEGGILSQVTVLPGMLSYDVLNRMDLKLQLQAGEVRSGIDKLGRGELSAELKGAQLQVESFKLAIPEGIIEGGLRFHPKANGTLDWQLRLSADAFELGVLARRAKPDSNYSAKADIEANLSASNVIFGNPQLKQASGKLRFSVCPRHVGAQALDIWATNLVFAMLPAIGNNSSEINCVLGELRLEKGVIYPELLALDTTRLRVGAEGKIDLVGDQYDLRLTPYPKRPQMFSMDLPVGVTGSLA